MKSDFFGSLLRTRRVEANLTQQQLADKAEVSVRALRYIEQGRVRRPRPESMRRLAHAVDIDLATMPTVPVHHEADGVLRVDLLGRLTVYLHDREIEISSGKQRDLLGLLALQPNRIVGRGEIVDVLWGDKPPATCAALVHSYVSRIRGILESASSRSSATPIETLHDGYRLRAEEISSDVHRFDELVGDAARHPGPAAIQSLAQALGLWRGQLLDGASQRLAQHPASVAISQRRLNTCLEYADLAIELGRHDDAIHHLRLLTWEEPLHEGLHARLMRALAHSGQQAAALSMFEMIRTRLADELGVNPGAELRAAHLAILRDRNGNPVGAELARPPVASYPPAQLPPPTEGFVGREESLAKLDLPHRDVCVPSSRLVCIVGMAGVGKTSLALHWAHGVQDKFSDGQLYADLRGQSTAGPTPPIRVLTQFLRALGTEDEQIPHDLEEATALYRTLLAHRKMLVLLDNVASADQLRPLLPAAPGCQVLVTSRNQLGGLVAREGARRIRLDVLSQDEATELLAYALGVDDLRVDVTSGAAQRLIALCARLPLALRIAACNLAHRGNNLAEFVRELEEGNRLNALSLDGDPDTTVRAVFDLSYRALSPEAQSLFRSLGELPRLDFNLSAAAAATGVSATEVDPLLDELVVANLLDVRRSGRYELHGLLKLYARERLGDEPAAEREAAKLRVYQWYLRNMTSVSERLQTGKLELPEPRWIPGTERAGSRA